MNFKWFAALSCLIFLFYSCTKNESIYIDGSTTVLPIISHLAEEYRNQHPDIRLIVNAGGSGVAVSQVGSGKVHIGMMSRELTEDETARYPDIDFATYIVGKDAIVPAVSKTVYEEGVRKLHVSQIRKMYAGEITNWSEAGGPDRDILVIDKERSRGTRHVFMEVIAGNPEAGAPGADIVLGSNNELQTAITQSKSAIGMLSKGWLNNDVKGITIITDEGGEIAPAMENIRNGRYPVVRDLLLITKEKPSDRILDFINFATGHQGQEIVEGLGYVYLDR